MDVRWQNLRITKIMLLIVVAVMQLRCAQSEQFFSQTPNIPTEPQIAGPVIWKEEKSIQYSGRFHAQTLFVLDNSGSMQQELADYVNDRLGDFLTELNRTSGLSYQIGFATTNFNGSQGKLIKSSASTSSQSILVESTPLAVFDQIYANFLSSENESGSGIERGLAAAAAAVTREKLTLFSEPPLGATLSRRVILISDADDTDSTAISNYTSVLSSVPKLSLHPIVALPGKPCSSPAHEAFGTRYVQAVDIVGGKASSICAPDFAQSLQSVFEWIQNVCITLENPVADVSQLAVSVAGVPVSDFDLDSSGTSVCVSMHNIPGEIKVVATHQSNP